MNIVKANQAQIEQIRNAGIFVSNYNEIDVRQWSILENYVVSVGDKQYGNHLHSDLNGKPSSVVFWLTPTNEVFLNPDPQFDENFDIIGATDNCIEFSTATNLY